MNNEITVNFRWIYTNLLHGYCKIEIQNDYMTISFSTYNVVMRIGDDNLSFLDTTWTGE